MAIYTNRYSFAVSTTETPVEETTAAAPQRSITEYEELRSVGRTLTYRAKSAGVAKKSLTEARRDRREIEREYNARLSEERRRQKKRGTIGTESGNARLEDLQRQKTERLAQQDAIISQKQASYDEKVSSYSTTASQYTEETQRAAFKAAPKQYRTGGVPVASFSDLRAEKQRQASDKALLAEVQERPGIIKGEQFRSQLYRSRYSGGVYTSVGPGTYATRKGTVTVTERSVPFTSAKTGRTEFKLLPRSETPQPKTYTAIDVFSRSNRDALREMSASGEYKTAGALFAGPQYSTQEQYYTPKPSEDLATKAYIAGERFKTATTPREQAKYATKNLYYFSLLTVKESKNNLGSLASAIAGGALWRTAETGFNRLRETGGRGFFKSTKRVIGKSGSFLGKIAPIGFTALYAAELKGRGEDIRAAPEGPERTRAAANVISRTGLEVAGFGIGYTGTSKILPMSAYATKPVTYADIVKVDRGRMYTEGTGTTPMFIRQGKTRYYSTTTFEGIRGFRGQNVRVVTEVAPTGGFTQRKFSRGFLEVTRQAPGSKTSTTTVYRRGKTTLYRRGDVANVWRGAAPVEPYYTRYDRAERGIAGDTVLIQRAQRTSLYGTATPIGRGKYLTFTGRTNARVTSITESRPTIFYRSRSDVVRFGNIRAYGVARRSVFGIQETKLRTAPKSTVEKQPFLYSRLAERENIPSGDFSAYTVTTLKARKGLPRTRIDVNIVTTGSVEVSRIGSAPTIASTETQNKRVERITKQRAEPTGKPLEKELTTGAETSAISVTRGKSVVTVSRLSARSLPKSRVSVPVRAFTAVRSRARIIPVATPRTAAVPRTGQVPRSTPIVRSSTIPRQSNRPAVVTQNRLSASNVSTSRLSTAQLTTTRLATTRPARTPALTFRPIAPRPPPIIVPGFGFPAGGGGSRKTLYTLGGQTKKYTPSLFAIGTGFKGKAPKRGALGFTIRPIRG